MTPPVFRFAPSPNGRLHLGHAFSALLNAKFAQRMAGSLLLRIEDIDPVRSRPHLIAAIEEDLAWLGLRFDGPVHRQSERVAEHRAAIAALAARGLAYPCFCSRAAVAENVAAEAAATGRRPVRDPDGSPLYPGHCRNLPAAEIAERMNAGVQHAWRLDMARALDAEPGPHAFLAFDAAGIEAPTAAHPVRWGDVVIGRRDVATSYHLAVVLDDAAQGVTHVVRGLDLLPATDLHVLLQTILGCASPAYHHHSVLRDAEGEKLAKSKGSESLADLRASGVGPREIRARLGFS